MIFENGYVHREKWRRALILHKSTIKKAISNMNSTGLQIVFAVNKDKKFVGTITDGDVRRGLLSGYNLNSSIDKITNRKPLVVSKETTKEEAIKIMQTNTIHHLPIIKSKKVIGVFLWDELNLEKKKNNIIFIMAGGKGKRLRPQTGKCPKPLLKVNGRPILLHIIERAKAQGFKNFVISVNYLGHMITKYFGDGKKFGVKISYIKEKKPLGTAGSLGLLKEITTEPIVVTNGDIISGINYTDLIDFHIKNNSLATMAVHTYELINPFGEIQTSDIKIVSLQEKPKTRSNINAGVYVIDPKAIKIISGKTKIDMISFFRKLKKRSKNIFAYALHESWVDIGRHEDLIEVNKKNNKLL